MIPAPVLLRGIAISLALTLIFELAYAWMWGVRERHDFLLVCAVNVLTNPIVVFAAYSAMYRRTALRLGVVMLIMETLAVVTEGLLYQKFARTIRRPWLFALSANAFSYAVGELINGLR